MQQWERKAKSRWERRELRRNQAGHRPRGGEGGKSSTPFGAGSLAENTAVAYLSLSPRSRKDITTCDEKCCFHSHACFGHFRRIHKEGFFLNRFFCPNLTMSMGESRGEGLLVWAGAHEGYRTQLPGAVTSISVVEGQFNALRWKDRLSCLRLCTFSCTNCGFKV